MERYEAYKDGGWLGDVPSSWNLVRISSLYDSRNEKVSDKDYPPLSVTMQGILPQLETAAKTQDGDNRKLVKKGDFAINSRSDRRGSCGISQYDGSVSLITNVLRPKDASGMDMRFFGHLFKSEKFSDEYFKQGTGIVDDLWSTNWSRMKNILVCCPDLESQQAIADFLDEKTAEIDGIVSETERSIELLREYRKSVVSEAVTKGLDPNAPMKDSGVEWIGEIPAVWDVARMSNFVRFHSGDSLDSTLLKSESPYPVYGGGNVKGRYDQSNISAGSVLVSRQGATCGAARYIASAAWATEHALIATKLCTMDSRWLAYFLGNMNLGQYSMTAAQPGISADKIESLPIVVASTWEQERIADYLDAKTSEIDALIADKERQVELLKEYRKSLISEAVTGKFKVPGVS